MHRMAQQSDQLAVLSNRIYPEACTKNNLWQELYCV